MSGILSVLVAGGGFAPFTSTFTVGKYQANFGKGPTTYDYFGYTSQLVSSSTTVTAAAGFAEATITAGSGSLTPTYKNATVLGVYSQHQSSGSASADKYFVFLVGDQTALSFGSLVIGGTTLSTSSVVATFNNTFAYSPAQGSGVTYVAYTPTTVTTTLFGTTTGANKSVVINL